MNSVAQSFDVIINNLDGKVHNPNIFTFLKKAKLLCLELEEGQYSADLHNLMKGFNYMWGDEFMPCEDIISPIIDDIYKRYSLNT